jgi:two-component system, LuxR family, response regulator FixJ
MPDDRTVFVVDDDPEFRSSVCALVSSIGHLAVPFPSAEEFLAHGDLAQRGVVVTDLRMPGMSGLELQEELTRRGAHLPVIVLTAFARTPITVRALKAGVVTMIDKPYADDDLSHAIRDALAEEAAAWGTLQGRGQTRDRLTSLTAEERRVLDMLVGGNPNKAIARELGLSVRTIEKRRRQVYIKMQVGSLAELVQRIVESRQ